MKAFNIFPPKIVSEGLHAVSDSDCLSSISANLKSDINIMRAAAHTNRLH